MQTFPKMALLAGLLGVVGAALLVDDAARPAAEPPPAAPGAVDAPAAPRVTVAADEGAIIVSADTWKRRLVLERSGDADTVVREEVALPYWPTALAALGERVIVAGKRPETGAVLLEARSLDAEGAAQILCEGLEPERGTVRTMCALRGVADALFLVFESGDVVTYDARTGGRALVVAGAALPALGRPELRELTVIGDEPHGSAYVLQSSGADARAWIFYDQDADGEIERWRAVPDPSRAIAAERDGTARMPLALDARER
jgi:hypothetical protein